MHTKRIHTTNNALSPVLFDTHGHINIMVKDGFDIALTQEQLSAAESIVNVSRDAGVQYIINVGTSLPESRNCIALAQEYAGVYATVGIHPNDCTATWRDDLRELETVIRDTPSDTIVGIGECGIDRHYPDYNLMRQADAFKAQIECALEHDLALVVHSRDAYDETLRILDDYRNDLSRGVIHCFSYDQAFADTAIAMGFMIGLGGTMTYPKSDVLRAVARSVPDNHIVLETDAPFLPIQSMRGKKNHPCYIKEIAEFLADLRGASLEHIAQVTTANAQKLFGLA